MHCWQRQRIVREDHTIEGRLTDLRIVVVRTQGAKSNTRVANSVHHEVTAPPSQERKLHSISQEPKEERHDNPKRGRRRHRAHCDRLLQCNIHVPRHRLHPELLPRSLARTFGQGLTLFSRQPDDLVERFRPHLRLGTAEPAGFLGRRRINDTLGRAATVRCEHGEATDHALYRPNAEMLVRGRVEEDLGRRRVEERGALRAGEVEEKDDVSGLGGCGGRGVGGERDCRGRRGKDDVRETVRLRALEHRLEGFNIVLKPRVVTAWRVVSSADS